jgi:hypothetical protein
VYAGFNWEILFAPFGLIEQSACFPKFGVLNPQFFQAELFPRALAAYRESHETFDRRKHRPADAFGVPLWRNVLLALCLAPVTPKRSPGSALFRRRPLFGCSDRRLDGTRGTLTGLRAGIAYLMKILDQQVDERPHLGW